MNELQNFYAEDGPERVGIITPEGEIVEFRNVSEKADQGFLLTDEDLSRLETPEVATTWHTHPGGTSNLSVKDREAFLAYPELRHLIVGRDGIAAFTVEDGALLRDEPA